MHQYNLRLLKQLQEESKFFRIVYIKLHSKRADIIKRKKKILRNRREGLEVAVERKATEDQIKSLEQSWNNLLQEIDKDWKLWEERKVQIEEINYYLWVRVGLMQDDYDEESLFKVFCVAFLGMLCNNQSKFKPILKLVAGIWIFRKFYKSIYANPSLLDNLPDILDLF